MRFPVLTLAAILSFITFSSIILAADAPVETKSSDWNGYEKLDFQVAGRAALLVKPKTAAPGNPWIWRTEFFGHEPQGDLALLGRGWHVAYIKVSDMYGAPPAIELMNQFHDYLTKTYGLNPRAVLEGFSRGGLYAVNFAATHPDKTAALYLDAPVLDIRSWPGGKGAAKGDAHCWQQALELYGLTEETAKDFKGSPLDRLEPVAAAKSRSWPSAATPTKWCRTGRTPASSSSATRKPGQYLRDPQARRRPPSAQLERPAADRGFPRQIRLSGVSVARSMGARFTNEAAPTCRRRIQETARE